MVTLSDASERSRTCQWSTPSDAASALGIRAQAQAGLRQPALALQGLLETARITGPLGSGARRPQPSEAASARERASDGERPVASPGGPPAPPPIDAPPPAGAGIPDPDDDSNEDGLSGVDLFALLDESRRTLTESPQVDPEFERRLIEHIRENGPMTWAEFMRFSLYEEGGYYASGKVAIGGAGDFMTAPEESPYFGRLTANLIADAWELMGRPDEFHIVEFGAGNGTWAKDILDHLRRTQPELHRVVRYTVEEVSKGQIAKQRATLEGYKVEWGALPSGGVRGIVISNEVPDAFPVHRAIKTAAGVSEKYVGVDERGNLIESEGPCSAELAEALETLVSLPEAGARLPSGETVPERQEYTINPGAIRLMERIGQALHEGFALTIDYGDADAMRTPPWAYFFRQREVEWAYDYPGGVDITSSVPFDLMLEAGLRVGLRPGHRALGPALESQEAFLVRHGLNEAAQGLRGDDLHKLGRLRLRYSSFTVMLQRKDESTDDDWVTESAEDGARTDDTSVAAGPNDTGTSAPAVRPDTASAPAPSPRAEARALLRKISEALSIRSDTIPAVVSSRSDVKNVVRAVSALIHELSAPDSESSGRIDALDGEARGFVARVMDALLPYAREAGFERRPGETRNERAMRVTRDLDAIRNVVDAYDALLDGLTQPHPMLAVTSDVATQRIVENVRRRMTGASDYCGTPVQRERSRRALDGAALTIYRDPQLASLEPRHRDPLLLLARRLMSLSVWLAQRTDPIGDTDARSYRRDRDVLGEALDAIEADIETHRREIERSRRELRAGEERRVVRNASMPPATREESGGLNQRPSIVLVKQNIAESQFRLGQMIALFNAVFTAERNGLSNTVVWERLAEASEHLNGATEALALAAKNLSGAPVDVEIDAATEPPVGAAQSAQSPGRAMRPTQQLLSLRRRLAKLRAEADRIESLDDIKAVVAQVPAISRDMDRCIWSL